MKNISRNDCGLGEKNAHFLYAFGRGERASGGAETAQLKQYATQKIKPNDPVDLRPAPGDKSRSLGKLKTGETFTYLGAQQGDYIKVQTPRGEQGWITTYYMGAEVGSARSNERSRTTTTSRKEQATLVNEVKQLDTRTPRNREATRVLGTTVSQFEAALPFSFRQAYVRQNLKGWERYAGEPSNNAILLDHFTQDDRDSKHAFKHVMKAYEAWQKASTQSSQGGRETGRSVETQGATATVTGIESSLLVRSGPSESNSKLTSLKNNQTVTYLGEKKGGYAKIQLPNGSVGWASSQYLRISGGSNTVSTNAGSTAGLEVRDINERAPMQQQVQEASHNLDVMQYQFRTMQGVTRATQEFVNGRAIEGGLIGWGTSALRLSATGKQKFVSLLDKYTDLKPQEMNRVYDAFANSANQQISHFSREFKNQHGVVGSNMKHAGKDILLMATGNIPLGHLLVPIRKEAMGIPGARTTLSAIAGKDLNYSSEQQKALREVNELIERMDRNGASPQEKKWAHELGQKVGEMNKERVAHFENKFETTNKDLNKERGLAGWIPGRQTADTWAVIDSFNSKDFPQFEIDNYLIQCSDRKGVIIINGKPTQLTSEPIVNGDLAITYTPSTGRFDIQSSNQKRENRILHRSVENITSTGRGERSMSHAELSQQANRVFNVLNNKLTEKYPGVSLDPYNGGNRIRFNGQPLDFTSNSPANVSALRNFVNRIGGSSSDLEKCFNQCHQILEVTRIQNIVVASTKLQQNLNSSKHTKIPSFDAVDISELGRCLPNNQTSNLCHRMAVAIPVWLFKGGPNPSTVKGKEDTIINFGGGKETVGIGTGGRG